MAILAFPSVAILDSTAAGRSLLTAADATAQRSLLGLGTLATQNGNIADYLTTASAATTYQPLDSDLTAIAALTTNSYGRSLLTQADAPTARTTLGLGTGDTPRFAGLNINNGVTPTSVFAYNTTDAGITNYERAKFAWESNILRIGTEKLGTGSARALEFQTDGVTRLGVSATLPQITIGNDANASLIFSYSGAAYTNQANGRGLAIFARSGLSANDIGFALTGDTVTATSGGANIHTLFNRQYAPTSGTGAFHLLRLVPVINQTGGANGASRGIIIAPTLTSAADYASIESLNGSVILTDTYAAGSGSLAGSLLNLGQTWNTTGTPTAILLNVTDTASNAASRFLDFRLGGTSRVSIDKAGSYFASNAEHASTYDCSSGDSTRVSERYFRYGGSNSDLTSVLEVAYLGGTVASPSAPVTGRYINSFSFRTGGTNASLSTAISFAIRHTIGSTIGSTLAEVSTSFMVNSTGTGVPFSALDLIGQSGHVRVPNALRLGGSGSEAHLRSDAAEIVAQRNGVLAQTFRVYNTFTDASNHERGKFAWESNILRIGTEKLGTGAARALELQTDGTTRLTLATNGTATFSSSITVGPDASAVMIWFAAGQAFRVAGSVTSTASLFFDVPRLFFRDMSNGYANSLSIVNSDIGIGTNAPTERFEVSGGKTLLAASTTSKASLNIPSGSDPTSPNNGDIWQNSNLLKVRLNGRTQTLSYQITSGTAAPTGGSDGDIYLQYI